MSKTRGKFAPEIRECAVRIVFGHKRYHPSRVGSAGVDRGEDRCLPQTLHDWLKRAEVDSGKRVGVPTKVADKLKELDRENRELG